MKQTGSLSNVVIILVWTLHLTAKGYSVINHRRYGEYLVHKLGNQYGLRRSGILETVQAMPTPTTPTARVTARGNTTPSSTENAENLHSVETKVDLKTNFSSPIDDNAVTGNKPVYQTTANGPQNLASYSLDPPNSFPQPTSIPAIDTLSATWPTPMGSIENEMNDNEPPTMSPIGNEMDNVEKIPGIERISGVERIPLSFEEEAPWERSHATSGKFMFGHASPGHASHTANSLSDRREKLVVIKSGNITSAHTRRRDNVASNPRDFSEVRDILNSNKVSSYSKFDRRDKTKESKQNTEQHANKHNTLGDTHHPYVFTNTKMPKRVAIPPPKSIGPIQPLLEPFQKEKAVGDIKEHTLDIENVKPNEAIDKHLVSIKSQPNIEPIEQHLSKGQPDAIEPIENHQLAENIE